MNFWIFLLALVFICSSIFSTSAFLCMITETDKSWFCKYLVLLLIFGPISVLSGFFYHQLKVEDCKTRNIYLTVPKDSSVNTQITSGNNTVNITDL